MTEVNENDCIQCFCTYQFDPSLANKALREQIAADLQVSPEEVRITVDKEVVMDTCENEWMLEAIKRRKKFTLFVTKSSLCTSSLFFTEVFQIGNGQASRQIHDHQWLLDRVTKGIRLELTVKQPSLNIKSGRKKITLKDLRRQMPLVEKPLDGWKKLNTWKRPLEDESLPGTPPVSPPQTNIFPRAMVSVPTVAEPSLSEVTAASTSAVTVPYTPVVAGSIQLKRLLQDMGRDLSDTLALISRNNCIERSAPPVLADSLEDQCVENYFTGETDGLEPENSRRDYFNIVNTSTENSMVEHAENSKPKDCEIIPLNKTPPAAILPKQMERISDTLVRRMSRRALAKCFDFLIPLNRLPGAYTPVAKTPDPDEPVAHTPAPQIAVDRTPFFDKLTLLKSMGFNNSDQNLEVLNLANGDVNRAVEMLLS